VGRLPEGNTKLSAFLGGAAICTAAAFTAQAADIPPQLMAKAPLSNLQGTYNWTGVYVGGHLGAGFGSVGWSDPFSGLTSSQSFTGFLGGAQVGANYQFNAIVFGLEGDFTGMTLNGSNTDSAGFGHNIKSNWSSTITGRIGYAINRALIYGKGGVAFAQDSETFSDPAGNVASNSGIRTGWTAGAGVEYALNRNWSARLEYDYLGFGSQNVTLTNPALGAGAANINLNVQRALVGINYRF